MRTLISSLEGGFPHSEIHGSKGARPSPQLIAACHVLHRLSMPRHPPNALESLDRSSSIKAFMHGENCAMRSCDRPTQFARAERARRCQSPSYVSNDGACAHGRTLIHDVIEPLPRMTRDSELVFSCEPKLEVWWSQTGSNRRPHACKARALPTELWPLSHLATKRGGRPGQI